jgi:plastocyanin
MVNVTRYARIVVRAVRRPSTRRWVAAAIVGLASVVTPLNPQPTQAQPAQAGQQWRVASGAESRSEGIQALAFYPAEIWVNAGDTITWSFPTGEDHTVTFGAVPAPPSNPNPDVYIPYPGPPFLWAPITASPATYSGSEFVNSGMLGHSEATFTVSLSTPSPTAGYDYRCLLHPKMTAKVYVQAAGTSYPHDQAWYDRQAIPAGNQLLATGRQLAAQARSAGLANPAQNQVAAGAGNGFVAVDRFFPETIRIRAGETVVWTNPDTVTPHTVTFGPEPLYPVPPPPYPATLSELAFLRPFGLDSDPNPPAPRHATISASTNLATTTINSAVFISGSPRPTFSVTFTAPGTYSYVCLLHDEFGMTGTVVVR